MKFLTIFAFLCISASILAAEPLKESESLYNQSIAKTASQNYTGAITDLNKVIQLESTYINVHSNRGYAKASLDDYIEITPKLAEAYNKRGVLKGKLEDHTGSIFDLTKSIELNIFLAENYYRRGLAKYLYGDRPGALGDLFKSEELGRKDASDFIKKINSEN